MSGREYLRIEDPITAGIYEEYKLKYDGCTRCPLYNQSHSYVYVRGILPSSILFVGEAPGVVEDTCGYPFTGPAGRFLDHLLAQVWDRLSYEVPSAFANILCCVPYDEDNVKVRPPEKEEAKACKPHLVDLWELAEPKLVVTLGTVAKKFLPREMQGSHLNLTHPSYFIRKGLGINDVPCKRFILTLEKQIKEMES